MNILQMWTGPIEVEIDDLFVIIGPTMDNFVSHDESFISDNGRDEPYDLTNMYNIFDNHLKLKDKPKASE